MWRPAKATIKTV